jgi:hypothetical protein
MPEGGGHGAHGAAPATIPTNWEDMTIAQALGLLTGAPPAMGMPLVTIGQVKNLMAAVWNGNMTNALKDVLQTGQDPNGWTTHRTFKGSEVCQNCTVLSARSDVVFENGTRADISHGIYLHHVASLNLSPHTMVNWIAQCPSSQTTFNGIDLQKFLPKQMAVPGGILSLGAVDEYSQVDTPSDLVRRFFAEQLCSTLLQKTERSMQVNRSVRTISSITLQRYDSALNRFHRANCFRPDRQLQEIRPEALYSTRYRVRRGKA